MKFFFAALIATTSAGIFENAGTGSVCSHKGWTGNDHEIKAEFDKFEAVEDTVVAVNTFGADTETSWDIRFAPADKVCIGWSWNENTHTYTSTDTWSNPALAADGTTCTAQATAFQKDGTVYSGTFSPTGTVTDYRNCFEVVAEPDLDDKDIEWKYTVKTYTSGAGSATDASQDIEVAVTMGLKGGRLLLWLFILLLLGGGGGAAYYFMVMAPAAA